MALHHRHALTCHENVRPLQHLLAPCGDGLVSARVRVDDRDYREALGSDVLRSRGGPFAEMGERPL